MFNKKQVYQKTKQKGINQQTKGNGRFYINIFKINSQTIRSQALLIQKNLLGLFTHARLLNIVATTRASILNPTLIVNIFQLTRNFLTVIGRIKAAPNHPAAILTKNSDRIWIKTILPVYNNSIVASYAYHIFTGQLDPDLIGVDDVKILDDEVIAGFAYRYGLSATQIKNLYTAEGGAVRYGPATGSP